MGDLCHDPEGISFYHPLNDWEGFDGAEPVQAAPPGAVSNYQRLRTLYYISLYFASMAGDRRRPLLRSGLSIMDPEVHYHLICSTISSILLAGGTDGAWPCGETRGIEMSVRQVLSFPTLLYFCRLAGAHCGRPFSTEGMHAQGERYAQTIEEAGFALSRKTIVHVCNACTANLGFTVELFIGQMFKFDMRNYD